MVHKLDRPVWNALTSRQAHVSVGGDGAVRYRSDIGLFAAAAEPTEQCLSALAALVPPDSALGTIEADEWPLPPGTTGEARPLIHQMVAADVEEGQAYDHIDLADADAPDMLALALMTDPGPFFSRTNRLGRFVGVREEGRLIAMAGERMKVEGFTEVSGVCTHPDYRGRGLAGAMMRVVARRILAEGDTPFLHTYAANQSAVRLYETLGFRYRSDIRFTILRRA